MNKEFTAEELKKLTAEVIGAAMEVHRALGPGLLESSYGLCLARELGLRGITFEREVPVPLRYKGVTLDCGYRADIVVAQTLLFELKAIETLLPIHEAQLISYLKLTGCKVGLLINFNVQLLKHGIRRPVVGLNEGITL
ncbi:MAG: GxxExxY protein [Chthoniobacterales bacterium]|nr:MAG: GxxExxY protein [Chthoniobacterales bacterium]